MGSDIFASPNDFSMRQHQTCTLQVQGYQLVTTGYYQWGKLMVEPGSWVYIEVPFELEAEWCEANRRSLDGYWDRVAWAYYRAMWRRDMILTQAENYVSNM